MRGRLVGGPVISAGSRLQGVKHILHEIAVSCPLEIEKGYAGPNGVIAAQFSKLHRLVSSLARQNCVDVF
jgi:hypothetical protein